MISRQAIRKALFSSGTRSLNLSRKQEASHFLINGDTGTFKSSLIQQFLINIEQRGETAIIWDPNSQYVPLFHSKERGDVHLDPSSALVPFWPIGDEVQDAADAMGLATCFFPPVADLKDPFWQQASTQIFAHLLRKGYDTAELGFRMAHDHLIDRDVKGTPFERMLTKNSPQMRAGILGHLNTAAAPLRLMPSTPEGRDVFTIREWLKKRRGWIFMSSKPEHQIAMRPLHAAWLGFLIMRTIAGGKRKDAPRAWFIIEEGSTCAVAELHTGMVRLRETDSPVVLAIQNNEDFKQVYKERAKTIISQPATKFIGRTSDGDSAQHLEALAGKKKMAQLRETRDYSFGAPITRRKSFSTEEKLEQVVPSSVIQNYPDLHVLVLQPGIYHEIVLPMISLEPIANNIPERIIPEITYRELRPDEVDPDAPPAPVAFNPTPADMPPVSPPAPKEQLPLPLASRPSQAATAEPSPPSHAHRYGALFTAVVRQSVHEIKQELAKLSPGEQVYFSPFEKDCPDRQFAGSLVYLCAATGWIDGLLACRAAGVDPNPNSLVWEPMIYAWEHDDLDLARVLMSMHWDPLTPYLDGRYVRGLAAKGNWKLLPESAEALRQNQHFGPQDLQMIDYNLRLEVPFYIRPKLACMLLDGLQKRPSRLHFLQIIAQENPAALENTIVRTAAIAFVADAKRTGHADLASDVAGIFEVIPV